MMRNCRRLARWREYYHKMVERIYWDSSSFLALLQAEHGRVQACTDTLQAAKDGEFLIVTSALTIAEVLWMRGAPKVTEEKARIVNNFFRRSSIRVVNLDRAIAQRAQRLVWDNEVRPKDAIHIATAQRYDCDILETFDEPLIAKGVSVVGVEFREPQQSKQGSLGL